MINELQLYSANGKIDSGILVNFDEISLNNLMKSIKNKNFGEMRKWVAENDVEEGAVYKKLYDVGSKYFKPASLPQLILILAKYQYQSAFAVDPDINLTAAIVEMAIELEFLN